MIFSSGGFLNYFDKKIIFYFILTHNVVKVSLFNFWNICFKEKMILNVLVQKVNQGTKMTLPFYATEQSAGMDLMAAIENEVVIKKNSRALVPTGIAIALPNGFEAQIRSRSGLSSKHGIAVLNAPGTIDADYRGEVIVILQNFSDEDFTITPGMRIAQMVVAPVTKVIWNEQIELPATKRDNNGFGSTGI